MEDAGGRSFIRKSGIIFDPEQGSLNYKPVAQMQLAACFCSLQAKNIFSILNDF